MALELTPLETLPPALEKAIGDKAPAPLKMMAAKGLAPLPPPELVTALYQLTTGADEALKKAAFQTAAGLPEKILTAALKEALDCRVLDFFARRLFQKPTLLDSVLLNKATSDETFVYLAGIADGAALDMIAKNEQRLLRSPTIIAALYMNKRTPMSVAQRAIELAVRNGVRVEGIPAFDEAAKAIEQSGQGATITPEQDAQFAEVATIGMDQASSLMVAVEPTAEEKAAAEKQALELVEQLESGAVPTDAVAAVEEAEKKKQKITDLPVPMQIRLATLGNAFARAVLIRSKIRQVAMACIRSPAIGDSEVLAYAGNRGLDEEIIRYIANNRAWMRLYAVKLSLANNPKCPLAVTMHILPHLHTKDLRMLAMSKGVPAAVSTAAKRMITARSGGDGSSGSRG